MTTRWAVLALLAAIANGCGSSTDAGPLGERYANAPGVDVCLPRRPGQSATFGVLYIDNPTDETLTLTSVSFEHSEGLTLLGSVIASTGLPLVASGRGYPPAAVPDEVWDQTQPTEGAEVESTEVISFGLRLDRPRGTASTVVIDYAVDGNSYTVAVDHTYRMGTTCS
jgi:hypothetical protein